MWEQTPFEQMPPPLCMGSRPWPLLIAAVMVLSIMPASANQAETETAPLEGSLLDVAFMPTSCLKNETCDAHRPVHLIEYFSADWCEPCVEVGEALNGMANNQTIVLQHHPSPQDSTFFSNSKQRNDDDYRLLFLPSIVLDGTHLLTGTRQAMDLVSTMENKSSQWQGLDNVSMANNTLQWSATSPGTVVIWALAPTPHENSGEIHPSVAYQRLTANASDGELALNTSTFVSNTSLVILLEQEGVRSLTVASLAPTGLMDLNDNSPGETTGPVSKSETYLPVLVGVFLALMLLPAFVAHRRLMKPKQTETTREIKSEE